MAEGPIYLQTYTGKVLDLASFKEEDVSIDDIAWSLSNLNRFNGHAHTPICVARHAVMVSRLVSVMNPELALEALHHDDAEAYVGDMTKFLKGMDGMHSYRKLEGEIQETIYKALGIEYSKEVRYYEDINSTPVKEADRQCLRFEAAVCFPTWKIPHGRYSSMPQEQIERIACAVMWDDLKVSDPFYFFKREHDILCRARAATQNAAPEEKEAQ